MPTKNITIDIELEHWNKCQATAKLNDMKIKDLYREIFDKGYPEVIKKLDFTI